MVVLQTIKYVFSREITSGWVHELNVLYELDLHY